MTTIAVIGAGNMGTSLIGGLIKKDYPANNIRVFDLDQEKLNHLKNEFSISVCSSNSEALNQADVVILAIKPQSLAPAAQEIKSIIQKNKPLVISIMAGIKIATLQKKLGQDLAIVRAMPNTPALIGLGATGLFANANVTPAQKALAEAMLKTVGIVIWLENEALIDTVTALSGSGPAYFFLILEALQQSAEELGLTRESAKMLTLQTALGAVTMAKTSDKSLSELRCMVTSPGGTTEKAIAVLEENNVRKIFSKALHSAKIRSEELANLND